VLVRADGLDDLALKLEVLTAQRTARTKELFIGDRSGFLLGLLLGLRLSLSLSFSGLGFHFRIKAVPHPLLRVVEGIGRSIQIRGGDLHTFRFSGHLANRPSRDIELGTVAAFIEDSLRRPALDIQIVEETSIVEIFGLEAL